MQEELRLRVTGQRPLKKRLWGLSSRILFARCRVQRLEAYEALGEALKKEGSTCSWKRFTAVYRLWSEANCVRLTTRGGHGVEAGSHGTAWVRTQTQCKVHKVHKVTQQGKAVSGQVLNIMHQLPILGGSRVVMSGVISPLIWVISIVTILITPLITPHEPASKTCSLFHYSCLPGKPF